MGTDSLDHSRQIVCVEYESEKSPERGLLERVDNYKRTLGMSMKGWVSNNELSYK